MDSQKSIDTILAEAIEIASESERQVYLDRVCGDNAGLRHEAGRLIADHFEAGDFLERPAAMPDATLDLPITEKPGTQIGPYKLLQQIGEGGMGVVYLAEQKQPVKRRVALKIIKPGMDTHQVIARFEAERQALAMMDHPNIAKVLEVGTTEVGRPYFVMELVKGVPITKYCDQNHLTPRERLELFVPICQAIQHAHQKGIIHRDIKPSNILVAEYDHQAVPKIIDFGVAKALNAQLTDKTMFTQLGQIIGTIEYMSPEQAKVNQMDVDTRSDIYSLGVVLYELLAGATPFDKKRLRSVALDELMRIIREEEPPRPSTRLSSIETLPSVAANRKMEPKKLSVLLHGELDWIVMKALEKDRGRRYETANGFASDIKRYLNDEAVVACPPSAAYRFRKFARRNKFTFAAGSMIAVALLIGIVGTSWQAIRATNHAERAKDAETNATINFENEKLARLDANDARQKERKARLEVQETLGELQVAKNEVDQLADESRQRLVRLYIDQGTEHVDQGDYTLALTWFLKALELDDKDPEHEKIHRLRIATTLDRCPKLVQVGFPDHKVESIQFYPDGQRMLLQGDGRCSVWHVTSGQAFTSKLDGYFARLSPDGQHVVHLVDGKAELRDSSNEEVIATLPDMNQSPQMAGFSQNGEHLFVGYDNKVQVWDVESGGLAGPVVETENPISEVRITPDGAHLVVSHRSNTVTTWNTESGERVSHISIDGENVGHIVVMDDAIAIQTGHGGAEVHVFGITDGRLKYAPVQHADVILHVAVSADSSRFLTSSRDNRAMVWDTKTGEPETDPLIHAAPVEVSTFSTDGMLVATGSRDGKVGLWSVESGQRIEATLRHPDRIGAIRLSPDARFLVSWSGEGALRTWDRAASLSAPKMTRRYTTWTHNPTFSHSGQLVAVACQDSRVRVYNIDSGELAIPPIVHTSNSDFCRFGPNDETILTSCMDGSIQVCDLTGTRLLQSSEPALSLDALKHFRVKQYVESANKNGRVYLGSGPEVRIIDNGNRLLCVNSHNTRHNSARLVILDAVNGSVVWGPRDFERPIQDFVVTKDEKKIIVGLGSFWDGGARIEFWSLNEPQLLRTIPLKITPADLELSSDGHNLLIGGVEGFRDQGIGYALVLNLSTGEFLTPQMRHRGTVFHVRYFANDRRILTSGNDGIVRVWNSDTGRPAAPEIRLNRRATSLALHPSESWVATGTGINNAASKSIPHFIVFWDVRTGESISPPFQHEGVVNGMAFSPDGSHIATTSRDRRLRLWQVPNEKRSLDELSKLVQLITGMRLDETDSLVPIDAGTFEKLWSQLKIKHPNEFETTTAEQIAWHRQQVSLGNGEDILDHLDPLVLLDPFDSQLLRQRIAVNRKFKHWHAIAPDVVRVMRLETIRGAERGAIALNIVSRDDGATDANRYALKLADQGIQEAPDDPHTWLARARINLNLDNLEAAEQDLSKVVEMQPGNYRPWYELALVQLALGKDDDYRKSCQQMREAIARTPMPLIENFVPWTCVLGERAIDQWSDVIDRAAWAREKVPQSVQYRNTLGATLFRAGRLNEALHELTETDQLLNDPSSSMLSSPGYTWYFLAMTYQQLGQSDEAQDWFDKAQEWRTKTVEESRQTIPWNRKHTLEILRSEAEQLLATDLEEETDPLVWLQRSEYLRKQGQSEEATAALTKGAELAPDKAEFLARLHSTRGQMYAQEKSWELAAVEFEELIKAQPEGPYQYWDAAAVAKVLVEAKRWDQAVDSLSKAIALDPDNVELYLARGKILADTKQWQRAIDNYSELIRLDPKNVDHYWKRTNVYLQQRNWEAVIEDCTTMIKLDPQLKHYNRRSSIHFSKNDLDLAIADCAESIRINPNDMSAHSIRFWARFGKQQFSRAREDNDAIMRQATRPYHCYLRPAYIDLARSDYEQALIEADSAIEVRPELPVAYRMKGWSLMQLGRLDTALESMNRAVTIDEKGDGQEGKFWSYFVRGCLHVERGVRESAQADFDKALIAFNESIGLDPALDIWETLMITIVHGQLGNRQRATEYYAQALELIERWPIDQNHDLLWYHDKAKSLLETSSTAEEKSEKDN